MRLFGMCGQFAAIAVTISSTLAFADDIVPDGDGTVTVHIPTEQFVQAMIEHTDSHEEFVEMASEDEYDHSTAVETLQNEFWWLNNDWVGYDPEHEFVPDLVATNENEVDAWKNWFTPDADDVVMLPKEDVQTYVNHLGCTCTVIGDYKNCDDLDFCAVITKEGYDSLGENDKEAIEAVVEGTREDYEEVVEDAKTYGDPLPQDDPAYWDAPWGP